MTYQPITSSSFDATAHINDHPVPDRPPVRSSFDDTVYINDHPTGAGNDHPTGP